MQDKIDHTDLLKRLEKAPALIGELTFAIQAHAGAINTALGVLGVNPDRAEAGKEMTRVRNELFALMRDAKEALLQTSTIPFVEACAVTDEMPQHPWLAQHVRKLFEQKNGKRLYGGCHDYHEALMQFWREEFFYTAATQEQCNSNDK